MRAGMIVALLALATQAHAAPPPGVNPDGAVGQWVRSLRDWNGESCCGVADCRQTTLRQDPSGSLFAWIGRQQFGPAAPDAWRVVPDIVRRGTTARGLAPGSHPWACWNGHDVICVTRGGTS